MGEYARLNKMLREDKARYEELKQKQNRTEEEDEALIDLYQGIGEIEGALLEMADMDGLDDPYEAFDYFEEEELEYYIESLTALEMGDFVLLKDNSVRQVLYNPDGSLSLYNSNYACMAHLSDYTDDFKHKKIDLFDIYKVLVRDAYPDAHQTVAMHFVSGTQLPQGIVDSIQWTWEREEDLSLNPNPVTM